MFSIHFLTAFHWLEAHNVWNAVVSWMTGFILGGIFWWVPWKKHRQRQNEQNAYLKELVRYARRSEPPSALHE